MSSAHLGIRTNSMKWKIQLVGDEFDLKELNKSFFNTDGFSITREKDGYYLTSAEFDSCKANEEVKVKAIDILDVLNGAKTLAIGGNVPIEYGSIVKENPDGTKEHFVELSDKITLRDSLSIVIKDSEGKIIDEVHPADEVPKWLTYGLRDEKLKKALRIYGKERHSWVGLYKVYEIIEDAVGGLQKIIERGWATKSSIKRFKHTVNSPTAIGDEARHGKEMTSAPKKAMHISEARSLIETLLIRWLNLNEDEKS